MSESMYDLIIIGGGPAGLTSLIYALRGGINTILIESNPYGCGQISLTERVDNYPGLYGISGFVPFISIPTRPISFKVSIE